MAQSISRPRSGRAHPFTRPVTLVATAVVLLLAGHSPPASDAASLIPSRP